MNEIKNIRHTGIVVKNLPRALKFYTEILGFKEIKRGRLEQYDTLKWVGILDCELVWVKLEPLEKSSLIELYYFENEELRNAYFDFAHVSFTISNAKQLFDKFVENNIDVICHPSIDVECKHKLFFIRDSENNLLEFVEEL